MSISPVASSVRNTPAVHSQTQLVSAKEVENDKDKDDGASKAVAPPAPSPYVNTNGQVVGSTINTQA